MDPAQAVDPAAIFSAKGLVVAITGGGSGTSPALSIPPALPPSH